MVEQILIDLDRSRRSLGNKVQVGLELIRPNQDVIPMRGLCRRGSEIKMKSSLLNCVRMRAHGAWWLFSDLNVFKSKRRLLGFVTGIRREGRRNFGDQRTNVHKLCILPVDQY